MRDGLIIRGRLFRNRGGKLPVIILSHGLGMNHEMCEDYAKLAAELGYAALTFDFNGGSFVSESSGKSKDMTVLTEVEDLKTVISFAKQLPEVDPSDITLLGCSQGGVVSAVTAAKLGSKIIKRLILLYPGFCMAEHAREGRMITACFDPENIPDVLQSEPMELSRDFARCVINWTLKDMTGGYNGKVLYLQGTDDEIVNVRYAREAVKEYPDAEYHEIAGGGHVFHGKYDEEAKEYIRGFLV